MATFGGTISPVSDPESELARRLEFALEASDVSDTERLVYNWLLEVELSPIFSMDDALEELKLVRWEPDAVLDPRLCMDDEADDVGPVRRDHAPKDELELTLSNDDAIEESRLPLRRNDGAPPREGVNM